MVGGGSRQLATDFCKWIGQLAHGIGAHIALASPGNVESLEDRSHQVQQTGAGRENAHHAGAALDFSVQPFDQVRGMEFPPVNTWEMEEGEEVFTGIFQNLGRLWMPAVENAQDRLQLLARRRDVGTGDDDLQEAHNFGAVTVANLSRQIAAEVNRASLPRSCGKDLLNGLPEATMGIADHQSHSGEPSTNQV